MHSRVPTYCYWNQSRNPLLQGPCCVATPTVRHVALPTRTLFPPRGSRRGTFAPPAKISRTIRQESVMNFGVMPILAPDVTTTHGMLEQVDTLLVQKGLLKAGDSRRKE